jgi:hypothetical protein
MSDANRTRYVQVALIAASLLAVVLAFPLSWCPQRHSGGPRCGNNLKNIVTAMLSYHERHGCLPPAYIADKDGKPMHSWRVLLLPELDEEPLYSQYRFSEPWNGPNNSKLANRMPSVFHCPQHKTPLRNADGTRNPLSTTSYVVVTGTNTAFPGAECRRLAGLRDDLILLTEVADCDICWLEPRDLDADKMQYRINSDPRCAPSSRHREGRRGGALVALADGSVHLLLETTDPATLRAWLTVGVEAPKFPRPVD